MNEAQVSFRKYKDVAEMSKTISLDFRVREACEAIQALMGLPENDFYKLGLTRTGKVLDEYLTFREAGVQQNDLLILIPGQKIQEWKAQYSSNFKSNGSALKSENSKEASTKENAYKLYLNVSESSEKALEYFVSLNEFYENHPENFFGDCDSKEKKKFEDFLRNSLGKVSDTKINRILKVWCEEISQGYRITELSPNQL